MKILVTGGAGYIGSHTVVELIEAGYDVVVIDDYSNSNPSVLERVQKIVSQNDSADCGEISEIVEGDVCDYEAVKGIFDRHDIEAVIHFAGFKAVGESVEKPLMYYQNNLGATMNLIRVMEEAGVKRIIFSSSATVYGMNNEAPFDESMPTSCTNPYGWTKLMSEQILSDAAVADESFRPVLLRYFNPVGAHPSGLIGENPRGIPNNLMPYVQQVASGIREKLTVFGDDYDTPDGTGVRDYIHVVDLAKGHVKALEWSLKSDEQGCAVFNLGTGRGTSVVELVTAFAEINEVPVPYVIGPRRAGDIATCYADASRAEKVLGWKAEKNIEDMCRDAWRWETGREQ
ncbi:MAG: UDP-glucose 4-epimerase GalE [Clostridia bacterium]|nr:UDP-glucose 4-epimerase GalE [Clostridia bacterium]